MGCERDKKKKPDPKFKALNELAITTGELIYAGNYEKFAKKQKEFLKLLKESGSGNDRFWAYYYVNQSSYHNLLGNHREFYKNCVKVIDIDSDCKDVNKLKVISYNNLAELYTEIKQFNLTNASLIEALQLIKKYDLGNTPKGFTYVKIAENYADLYNISKKNKKDKAEQYLKNLKKNNEIAHKLLYYKDKDTTSYKERILFYSNLATNFYTVGERQKAQQIFNEQYNFAKERKDWVFYLDVFFDELNCKMLVENNVDVKGLMEKINRIEKDVVSKLNHPEKSMFYFQKAQFCHNFDYFSMAIEYSKKALPYYQEINDEPILGDLNLFLANGYRQKGMHKLATAHYDKKNELNDILINNQSMVDLEKSNTLIDVFEAREQERVEFEKAKNERQKNYLIAVSLGLILLLLFLVLLAQRNAGLKTKQKLLASEIQYNKEMNEKLELENIYQIKNDLVAKKALHTSNMEIAKNLHDDMASGLAALNFLIADKVRSSQSEEEKKRIDIVKEEVNSLYENFRKYIHHLYSQGTKEFSFSKIFLSNMIRNNSEIETELLIDFREVDEKLNVYQQNQLLRILSEAVTNVYKYSKGSKAKLEVSFENNNCNFKVEDNGIGFNLNMAGGIGLENMKERAALLGGELHIQSNINKGTMISGIFPI